MVQNFYKLGLTNVLIFQEAKCLNTLNMYTTNPLFYNSSINTGSISFFSSSDTHQSHYLPGCHTTGINCSFSFFKFSMLDKKAVLTREKIKRNMLDKKAVLTREKILKNMIDKKAVLTREKIKPICLTKKLFNSY